MSTENEGKMDKFDIEIQNRRDNFNRWFDFVCEDIEDVINGKGAIRIVRQEWMDARGAPSGRNYITLIAGDDVLGLGVVERISQCGKTYIRRRLLTWEQLRRPDDLGEFVKKPEPEKWISVKFRAIKQMFRRILNAFKFKQ